LLLFLNLAENGVWADRFGMVENRMNSKGLGNKIAEKRHFRLSFSKKTKDCKINF